MHYARPGVCPNEPQAFNCTIRSCVLRNTPRRFAEAQCDLRRFQRISREQKRLKRIYWTIDWPTAVLHPFAGWFSSNYKMLDCATLVLGHITLSMSVMCKFALSECLTIAISNLSRGICNYVCASMWTTDCKRETFRKCFLTHCELALVSM